MSWKRVLQQEFKQSLRIWTPSFRRLPYTVYFKNKVIIVEAYAVTELYKTVYFHHAVSCRISADSCQAPSAVSSRHHQSHLLSGLVKRGQKLPPIEPSLYSPTPQILDQYRSLTVQRKQTYLYLPFTGRKHAFHACLPACKRFSHVRFHAYLLRADSLSVKRWTMPLWESLRVIESSLQWV